MHMFNCGAAKIMMSGALIAVSAGLYSAPAAAVTKYRTVYQNTGNCHGIVPAEEDKLERFAQSLRNTSASTASVVCNLATDWLSVATPSQSGGSANGNVTYVAIWAKNLTPASPKSMTCVLIDGYANEAGSASYTRSVATLASGTAQSVFSWRADTGKQYLAPVNITCDLPPDTELNDWYVVFKVDVGL